MAQGDNLQWITLSDFRAGIMDRTLFQSSVVAPFPQGSATKENTFRCIALPEGGLGPLPRVTSTFTMTNPDTTAQVVNGRYTLTGFVCQGPVSAAGANGIDSSNLIFGVEWVNSTTARRRYVLYRARMWEATPTLDTITTVTDTDTTAIRRPTYLHSTRASAAAATNPGVPVAMFTWFSGAGGGAKLWAVFPPPTASNTLAKTDISTTLDVEPSVTHQGRSIAFDGVSHFNGSGSFIWQINEQTWYTNSNLTTLQNAIADTFGQEDPTGIAVAISMTANELFIVKNRNGGFVIRGDIADPTVLRLPGVTGANGSTQMATASPIGAVYGVNQGGAWVWAGGEESQLLSPSLEQGFMQGMTGQSIFNSAHLGRFETMREWIFTANNWIYDWRQKSWWRFDDPADREILHWCASVQGTGIFGMPVFMDATDTTYAYFYNFTSPALDYSWQSQPLPQSTQQDIEVRQLVLVAEGSADSTVTVTLKGLDGATSTPQVFTLNSTSYLDIQRASTSLRGGHIQVLIEADGGANPAPIIHELRIGYNPTTSLPNEPNPS